jgi:GNAT superfamily N-acetyltransferase
MIATNDPMGALKSLERALGNGIALMECELNPSIDLVLDFPAGEQSMSYANIEQGAVKSLAVLLPTEPIEGVPCFGIAFAVNEIYRRQGLAAEIVDVAIAELSHGLGRNGIIEFYIEATVAAHNVGAQKVALKVLSTDFDEIVNEAFDNGAGALCYRYRRLVPCA